MVNHVVYHYILDVDHGEAFELPPRRSSSLSRSLSARRRRGGRS
jgi:hypothetical protein